MTPDAPESREVVVRVAESADMEAMCGLLGQLGYPVTPEDLPARLARLAASPGASALVAVRAGRIAGLATMQIISTLNRDATSRG